jgi:HAD superfamily hydrolase (TIGR01450 family)
MRAVALDMDGVLKVGLTAIPGADDTVKELIARGYKLMVVTNECRWTPVQISEALLRMGLPTAAALPIYTASVSTRDYLMTKPIRKLSVIGSKNLKAMLSDKTDNGDEDGDGDDYLVMGTMETVSHADITMGTELIAQGYHVVLTCSDRLDPSKFTIKMPRDVLEMCSTKTAIDESKVHSAGKPHPIVVDGIISTLGEPADRILFIGDTMDTDIKIAKNAGFKSALVLSGNTSVEDLPKYEFAPDYVIRDINELLELLPKIK